MQSEIGSIKGSRILIVDDHRNIRLSLQMTLEDEGALVFEAPSLASARGSLGLTSGSDGKEFDLILLDIRLPDGNGLDLLDQLNKQNRASRVIIISGEGTSQDAYRATQTGAFDFIEKPFTAERVIVTAKRCIAFNRIEEANTKLRDKQSRSEIVGHHQKIKDVITLIHKVAPTTGRVLITGESGTGKELIAREIHRLSTRATKTMIKVNCAAIPKNLMESELFGHEKGAFTGAAKTRLGVFERADGGTLFLDEIGELDLDVQAKLLRVLQNGEFTRVGGEKTLRSDVRIVCATNRDLKQMCETGDFREDLYYRLNVVTIHSPALRERASDIAEIAKQFLKECCDEHSLGPKEFSEQAISQLSQYQWPGNVRELRNVIERTAIFSSDSVVDHIEGLSDLPPEASRADRKADQTTQEGSEGLSIKLTPLTWEQFQTMSGREFLTFMLKKSGGNVSEAARTLDLERAYLHRLMKKLGIHRT